MTNHLFYLESLGCKMNQLDGERVRNAFIQQGYTETDDPGLAQVIIVNACSVTGNAERQSRYRFRRVSRMNPDATRYLIGCIPEKETDETGTVLSAARKFDIGEIREALTPFPRVQTRHVRPLVHIQSGCNLSCSYCIVPSFRGPSRSVPEADVGKQVQQAIDAGRAEVVLTGIHLGTWGRDLSPRKTLADLLAFLCDGFAGHIRVRVSSLDSNEIDEPLIRLFALNNTLCPHLHIPLQSGCDRILNRMRRRYNTESYRKKIEELAVQVPDVCLGADVIVGFPGETDADFSQTYRFLEESDLHYFHVFPFSAREGTDAATMPDPVDERCKKKRVFKLRELSDTKRTVYVNRFENEARAGVLIYPDMVLTDNYIQVSLPEAASDVQPGSPVRVMIGKQQSPGLVKGRLV